jgi:hypothetical protein
MPVKNPNLILIVVYAMKQIRMFPLIFANELAAPGRNRELYSCFTRIEDKLQKRAFDVFEALDQLTTPGDDHSAKWGCVLSLERWEGSATMPTISPQAHPTSLIVDGRSPGRCSPTPTLPGAAARPGRAGRSSAGTARGSLPRTPCCAGTGYQTDSRQRSRLPHGGTSPSQGWVFGEPPRAILRFRHQDAPTPPSPLVGEGGRGDEGQTRTGMQKITHLSQGIYP